MTTKIKFTGNEYLLPSQETCRACGSRKLEKVMDFGPQFVSTFTDENSVTNAPRVPIELDFCHECTLVQQRYSAPAELLYRRHYWYRSGVTDTMKAELRKIYETACVHLGRTPGKGDVVLDIGANDGTLLSFFPGECTRAACEPAENLHEECRRNCDVLIPDFWSWNAYMVAAPGAYAKDDRIHIPKATVITSIGMLYDLEDPTKFVADVAEVLAPEGVFIAQLQCMKQTFQSRDVGNFCHEHLEFYTLKSLYQLFLRCGLAIIDVTENRVNGGSYRIVARHLNSKIVKDSGGLWTSDVDACTAQEDYFLLGRPDTYRNLQDWMQFNRSDCVSFLLRERDKGKKIWVYGASTKGNTILQWYGLDSSIIVGAADRDPNKHGKYTVGTGIKIVSEEEGRAAMPDYFLVLPYAFLQEFLDREREQPWRKAGGKFVVPLPEFRVL